MIRQKEELRYYGIFGMEHAIMSFMVVCILGIPESNHTLEFILIIMHMLITKLHLNLLSH